MQKNESKRYGLFAVLVMLSVFAICFCLIVSHFGKAEKEQLDRRDALNLQLSRIQNENSQLSSSLSQIGSASYAENVAREQYGYIKRGEKVFTFTNPELLDNYTDEEFRIYLEEMGY